MRFDIKTVLVIAVNEMIAVILHVITRLKLPD